MSYLQSAEYGVICDRRSFGLGLTLLATSKSISVVWRKADEKCSLKGSHTHLLKIREIIVGDWQEEALAGETFGGVA